ncbi:universal stress protein [Streptomyces sp. NBC_01283]|uniref:universal stress protein n=1 Tax=Streptomyces sp. NBC_01283 TaxID=2903812 RepID=UPI00352D00C9|nr:universal stress protein [Streptomyces sp. NBC_01283]
MSEHGKGAGRPVLVGVEQGGDQPAVVRYAARHASLHGLPLTLLHVAAEGSSLAGPGEGHADGGEPGPVTQAVATLVKPLVELVETEFPDVAVTAEAVAGRPAAVLVERSAEAAWLVVGHRGGGGFPRLPLGSVSWQVATHASCPVVVVRPGENTARENRVVVGVDVHDVPHEALDLAYAEAHVRGARLEMVYGAFHLGQMPAGPGMVAPNFEELDERARQALRAEAAKRLSRYPEVAVDLRVEQVRPATILSEASRHAALLVVGSHGRTGLRRLMLGSVSGEALHTAECPVAVVPHRH